MSTEQTEQVLMPQVYAPPVPAPVLPPMMFSTHERMSFLIHGDTKLGKSTLAATAPYPILVLDAEGSWRFTAGRKVYWDPMTEPVPVYDGTWDICIVHVRNWETLDLVFQMVLTGQTVFVTVVLDSITELQRRLKKNLEHLKTGKDGFKFWGELLDKMDATIRGFRDFGLISDLTVRCVVFISETEHKNGKWCPSMQGQIGKGLPYWVDVCGYMYRWAEVDPSTGTTSRETRQLWISPHDQFIAGSRVQEFLGSSIEIPAPVPGHPGTVIQDWMRKIFNKGNDQ